MKRSFKHSNNEGFSLIELVIVIAVLSILAIVVGGPYFLKVINMARFASAKNYMRESFTSCINSPNLSPSNPNIPGVAFQSSNCSSLMSATIDSSCTISMNMSTGAKTGWADNYDSCVAQTKLQNSTVSTNPIIAAANNSSTNEKVISEYNFDAKGYDLWEERGFPKDKCDWNWDVGCRHERERQALTAYYKRDLAEQVEKSKSFPQRHQEIHLDVQEEMRTGNKVCRDNSGKRENCPNTNEFDKTKLEILAKKHLEERKKLNDELLQKMIKNKNKQIPEIEKARAKRRQQLIDRGLALNEEEVGNKSSCRDYWGWKVNCPATKELKNHQEKLKTDSTFALEQANLKKLRDLDSYDHDAYHNSQMERGLWSQERIRNNYEKEIGELYKKQQKELDEIRVSR